MSPSVAIAHSQAADPQEAAYQSCLSIKAQLNAEQVDLVFVFACGPYASMAALDVVHSILRPKRLVGSSTAGIILSNGIFNHGIAVIGINAASLVFGTAVVKPLELPDLRTAGFEWARRLNVGFTVPHQACLLFSDPAIDIIPFILGAQEVLGFSFPILGAIGSGDHRNKSVQLSGKQPLTHGVVGLLMGSDIAYGHAHGFKLLGKPRTITQATGNVINTIDNRPAADIYREFLGPEAAHLGQSRFPLHELLYPLGIYVENHQQYLLKNPIEIQSDGSIVCQGDVPQGAEVHMMIGNRATCKDSAHQAAMQVKDALGGRQARFILVIESVTRQRILKNNSMAEVQAIKEVLGHTTPIAGMLTAGEIVPRQKFGAGSIYIQNGGIVIIAFE